MGSVHRYFVLWLLAVSSLYIPVANALPYEKICSFPVLYNPGLKPLLDLANQIKDPAVKALALSDIAVALRKPEYMSQASQLLNQAVAEAQHIKFGRERILAEIAPKIATNGDLEQARALLKQAVDSSSLLERKDWQHSSVAFIAIAYAKMGDEQKALDLVKTIQDESITSYALQSIALIQAEKGNKNSALLKKALEQVEQISEPVLQARAVSNITKALAKGGEIEQALALSKKINVGGWQADALEGIAQEVSHKRPANYEWLTLILNQVETIPDGSVGRDATLKWVVHASSSLNSQTEQKQVLKKALALAKTMDYCAPATFRAIAKAMAQQGDEALSITVIEEQLYGKELAGALTDMALHFTNKDATKAKSFFAKAVTVANGISEADFAILTKEGALSAANAEKASALAEIAVGLLQSGDVSQSDALFEKAFVLLPQIPLPHYRQEALECIASKLGASPSWHKQNQWFERLFQMVATMKEDDIKVTLIKHILTPENQ